MRNKLEVKDLVNVGVFTAVYFIVFFIAASTGMIPIMAVFFPVLSALLAGIPMILFFTRINKFGCVLLLCLLSGLINFGMGYGFQSLIGAFLCGLLADLIMSAGKYKSWVHMIIGYVVFSEWTVFTMLPMWLKKDEYFVMVRELAGNEFADEASALITNSMLVVVIVAIIIGAIAGAYIGKKVLVKHFKKAGIV